MEEECVSVCDSVSVCVSVCDSVCVCVCVSVYKLLLAIIKGLSLSALLNLLLDRLTHCVTDGVGEVVVPHFIQYPSNQVLRGRSSRLCNLIGQFLLTR